MIGVHRQVGWLFVAVIICTLNQSLEAPVDLGGGVCGGVSNPCDDAYVVRVQVSGQCNVEVCDPDGWRPAAVPIHAMQRAALLDANDEPTGERLLLEWIYHARQPADFDGDGDVDVHDFMHFVEQWTGPKP